MPCSWRRKSACKRRRARSHHFHGMLLRLSMDHVHLASAAVTDRHIAKSCTPNSGEMTDVEEDKLAERWSDACGVLGRGFVRAGRRGFGPGRGGLLQDGRRAERLRGAADAGREQRWSLRRSSALPVSASARPASVFVAGTPDEPRWPGQSRRPSLSQAKRFQAKHALGLDREECDSRFCMRETAFKRTDAALTGSAVAVGKAVGQCQPHARALMVPLISPLGAGAQFQLRATARRAASHVAQAARRFYRACRRTVGCDLKTLAVVLDGDAAAVEAIGCLRASRSSP